jgi:hypothetical protein
MISGREDSIPKLKTRIPPTQKIKTQVFRGAVKESKKKSPKTGPKELLRSRPI